MTEQLIENWDPTMCPWCRSYDTEPIDTDFEEEKRICRHCNNDYIVMYNTEDKEVIEDVTTRNRQPINYTWKDLILYNNKVHAMEFPISGKIDEFDDDFVYQIDDFISSAAKELKCDPDDMILFSQDPNSFNNIDYDDTLPFGAEHCGAYVNNLAEWTLY